MIITIMIIGTHIILSAFDSIYVMILSRFLHEYSHNPPSAGFSTWRLRWVANFLDKNIPHFYLFILKLVRFLGCFMFEKSDSEKWSSRFPNSWMISLVVFVDTWLYRSRYSRINLQNWTNGQSTLRQILSVTLMPTLNLIRSIDSILAPYC